MKKFIRIALILLLIIAVIVGVIFLLNKKETKTESPVVQEKIEVDPMSIVRTDWSYDENNNYYYQQGLIYCNNPQASQFENMAVYVPGDYFNAVKNNSLDTYTCYIKDDTQIGNYSPANAPIVMPIYQKENANDYLKDAKQYTEKGYIFVYAKYRGIQDASNSNLLDSVVDLKAAIRFLKYNKLSIPANNKKIFVAGEGSTGALSAILGATCDSMLFDSYLTSLNALFEDKEGNPISDSIFGAMSINPVLNEADDSYNPMYYLLENSRGFGTSILAKKWLIKIDNLAEKETNILNEDFVKALEDSGRIDEVSIITEQKEEEKTQSQKSEWNLSFIDWVEECTK